MIGVAGDGEPGRHHWFFTPAPLYLAWGREDEEEWLDLGIVAPVEELTFVEAELRAARRRFPPPARVRRPHRGRRRVRGADARPHAGRARSKHGPTAPPRRPRRARRSAGNRRPATARPGGPSRSSAAGERSSTSPRRPAARRWRRRRRKTTTRFLETLEREGLTPGTVVLDDKWQSAYGTNEPDTAKWPDLKAWIARSHEEGRHILLWWKAWDSEGLPPELCIRNRDGVPVAVDPTNPAAREALAGQMHTAARSGRARRRRAQGRLHRAHAERPPPRDRGRRLGDRALAPAARGRLPRGEGGEAGRARDHADAAPGVRRRHRHDPAQRHDRRPCIRRPANDVSRRGRARRVSRSS